MRALEELIETPEVVRQKGRGEDCGEQGLPDISKADETRFAFPFEELPHGYKPFGIFGLQEIDRRPHAKHGIGYATYPRLRYSQDRSWPAEYFLASFASERVRCQLLSALWPVRDIPGLVDETGCHIRST